MAYPVGSNPKFVEIPSVIADSNTPQMQAVSVQYTVTSNDVTNGYASIPSTWPVPFPDANYIIVQGITHNSFRAGNDYSTGACDSLTGAGFNSRIYVNSLVAQAGDIINLNSLAIHL